MYHNRPTVADIRAQKGVRQLSMLYVDTQDEARAASAASIDILSIIDPAWTPQMREAAGDCFVQVGLLYGELVTSEDYLRAAHKAIKIGGDCVYCAASIKTIKALAEEGIPVVGHVGLIPSKCTWTGGFKAVGKTSQQAMAVWDQVQALEAAGAFGAELEVVPDRVAAEISRRTSLIMFGMGAGPHADAQYLFAEDVLGYTPTHRPRHAKVYRNFRAELIAFRQSGSRHSRNLPAMWIPVRIRHKNTLCPSMTRNSRISSTGWIDLLPPRRKFSSAGQKTGLVGLAKADGAVSLADRHNPTPPSASFATGNDTWPPWPDP